MIEKPKKTVKKKYERALILSGGGSLGAYQVGVLQYLEEKGWKPDLICGSSVGALNAAFIGCGYSSRDLTEVWASLNKSDVFRIPIWRHIKDLFFRKGFSPLVDTTPLQKKIYQYLDVDALRSSEIEVIVTAVNLNTSELKYFGNQEIKTEHLMAANALPVVFPWHYIDGEPHWDGGSMMNTPLLPALERQTKEIIVVVLSALGHKHKHLRLPRSRLEALERIISQMLMGSYRSVLAYMNWMAEAQSKQTLLPNFFKKPFVANNTKITTIMPDRLPGFSSVLNFSSKSVLNLVRKGYEDAEKTLTDLFKNK